MVYLISETRKALTLMEIGREGKFWGHNIAMLFVIFLEILVTLHKAL